MPDTPRGVTAVTENGLRIPCDIRPDGMDKDGYPKYRIAAEVNWHRFHIARIEVEHWPDRTALALQLDGARPDEAMRYSNAIQWVDLGSDAV